MNSVQIHLALTHVPVILSLIGLVMFVVAFFMKNSTLTNASYVIILFAGLAAIPVFFTGEGAEESIENLPGVSDVIIEKHEEVAKLSMFSIAAAGFMSLMALISIKRKIWMRGLGLIVFILSTMSAGLMIQTAHLGGQIRHSEIRGDVVLQIDNEKGGNAENNGGQQPENDDD